MQVNTLPRSSLSKLGFDPFITFWLCVSVLCCCLVCGGLFLITEEFGHVSEQTVVDVFEANKNLF